MSEKIPEKILLYRLQTQHDPEAFAELYDFYVKRIYRFVFFKVSNHEEAEDITADVFLKAWNFINEHKEIKSFSGLLYRVARNCIIDVYRARASQPELLSKDEVGAVEQSDGGRWYAGLSVQIENQKVVQGLKKLKQEYQEVITLRYVDELEIEEISAITGKGKIAVRVTLHRALKKLKELTGEN
ncbi:MAG: RNA polymerase sigma factor [Patescibacteria group bacterium]